MPTISNSCGEGCGCGMDMTNLIYKTAYIDTDPASGSTIIRNDLDVQGDLKTNVIKPSTGTNVHVEGTLTADAFDLDPLLLDKVGRHVTVDKANLTVVNRDPAAEQANGLPLNWPGIQQPTTALPNPNYSASASQNTLTAQNLFDFNSSSSWYTNDGMYELTTGNYLGTTSTTVSGFVQRGEWFQLQANTGFKMNSFVMLCPSVQLAVKDFNVAGSNDGITWAQIGNYTGQIIALDGIRYVVSSTNTYSYFRFILKKSAGGTRIELSGSFMYETTTVVNPNTKYGDNVLRGQTKTYSTFIIDRLPTGSAFEAFGACLQITNQYSQPTVNIFGSVTPAMTIFQFGHNLSKRRSASLFRFDYYGDDDARNRFILDSNANILNTKPAFTMMMPPQGQYGNVGIHSINPIYPLDIQDTTVIRNVTTGKDIFKVDANDGDILAWAVDGSPLLHLPGGSTILGIGYNAGAVRQGVDSIAIGSAAGQYDQGSEALAIGVEAGHHAQGNGGMALGKRAGYANQGAASFAVGDYAGESSQGVRCIAFGNEAGRQFQGQDSVAIGFNSGRNSQGYQTVAIGQNAGETNQATIGGNAVAVGFYAGNVTQATNTVAVGKSAGQINQGSGAVSVGANSAATDQGLGAVAVGAQSGKTSQKQYAVAVGSSSGYNTQGTGAVAVGTSAGEVLQGANSIAIGLLAGQANQHANSIILSALGTALNSTQASSCFINPIRNSGTTTFYSPMYYNTTTSEVSHVPDRFSIPTFSGSSYSGYFYIMGNILVNFGYGAGGGAGAGWPSNWPVAGRTANNPYFVQPYTTTVFGIFCQRVQGNSANHNYGRLTTVNLTNFSYDQNIGDNTKDPFYWIAVGV